MIVDSSAALAVVLDEPESDAFSEAINQAERCLISSVSYLESSMVVASRRGVAFFDELDAFLKTAGIDIAPFTMEHARIARRAFANYGKGSHPAGLNFGDCASYALAIIEGEPLLYKGSDFSKTDVEPARSQE